MPSMSWERRTALSLIGLVTDRNRLVGFVRLRNLFRFLDRTPLALNRTESRRIRSLLMRRFCAWRLLYEESREKPHF
jgi:hypothetical protein